MVSLYGPEFDSPQVHQKELMVDVESSIETSAKLNQNNEITNAICWLSVTAFW